MKVNKKALQLIDKGLSSKTVSKLTESQINVLHSKLLGEATVNVSSKNPNASQIAKDMTSKGISVTVTEKDIEEQDDLDNNDALGADAMQSVTGQETPHDEKDMAPDGMDDDSDNNRKEMGEADIKKGEPNPWAICHAQVGPKKTRKFERCVMSVKKQLKEGKNPVSLFLETQIQRIVEKHIPPRITKGDLLKVISESEPTTAPTKPKTKPKTNPTKRPSHPGKNPNPGENPTPKAKKGETKEQSAPTTKPAPTKPGTKPDTRPRPSHPGKNPNPGENPAPKAKKSETKEQQTAPAPTTKPAPTKPGTRPDTKPRPSHPGKNPNPGENPAPKAGKVSPEEAKDKVIDVIMNLLKK